MADSLDLFTGILLTVIGLVLVYGSIAYRLIDLILILGVLITLFGLYKLLPAFISRIMGSKKLGTSRRGNKLNKKSKNNTYSRVKEGAKEVENIVNSKLDGNNNSKSKSILETHDEYYSDDKLDEPTATLDEFLKNSKTKVDVNNNLCKRFKEKGGKIYKSVKDFINHCAEEIIKEINQH